MQWIDQKWQSVLQKILISNNCCSLELSIYPEKKSALPSHEYIKF